MKNIFNSVRLSKPKKNKFDLTHDVKLTGKFGDLIPVCVVETLPGDKFSVGADAFIRFAPLIAPVMHRLDMTIHYFYVPYRILWDNWEKFITDPQQGGHPYMTIDGTLSPAQERFLDYMGIPPYSIQGTQPLNVSCLPMAAYQAIYHEYYRDQNLIPEFQYKVNDGLNPNTILATMRKRSYEHDYFTAGLPWAQKGAEVDIPLGEVVLKGNLTGSNPHWQDSAGVTTGGPVTSDALVPDITIGGNAPQYYDPDGSLITEPTTINDLRRAFRLQEWLERNARGGTRYIENILAHWGIWADDSRLQRPEYITGVKSPVVVSEVLNTTGESAGLPQGNMAGHAVSVASGYKGEYLCKEHGVIIGIMSVMPKPAYMQGVNRMYLRQDTFDYPFPTFANIGEQPIKAAELYAYQSTDQDEWAYIPRYAECKYQPNRVAGDFRTTLNYWTLVRDFASLPPLAQEFLEVEDTEFADRIFAVNDGTDYLFCQILNKVQVIRALPVFGTPQI